MGRLTCVACLGIFLFAGALPDTPEAYCAPQRDWPADFASLETAALAGLNEARAAGAACGDVVFPPAPALTDHAALRCAARNHARAMADGPFFDHTDPNGITFGQRIGAAGFAQPVIAENIAAGRDTVPALVHMWLGSPAHCRNLMRADFNFAGVGFVRAAPEAPYPVYWVLDLGA